ncbi:MAG: sulfotransferase domain-containing protein [Cyanobacteriota bacterium]
MNTTEPYWYLASYPKSGNTWCRVFITELRRLAGLDSQAATAAAQQEERELRLNRDLATGSIVSSRHWLDDQLGIDSSDLRWSELDKLRGRVGHQRALYAECLRYHKVHDAFVSADSGGRPVVPVEGCKGAVVVIRHPADVAVSLSHFFSWDLERCVAFQLNEQAALCRSSKRGGQQVRQFMGSWANHVRSWMDQDLIPVLLLRYEDVLAQPEQEFSRLAQFLDLPAEQALIAEAVANTRFDKLRAKEEEEGGFHERPEGCERFFRSGRSGEGQERLSVEQWGQMQDRFRETLSRFRYQPMQPPAGSSAEHKPSCVVP